MSIVRHPKDFVKSLITLTIAAVIIVVMLAFEIFPASSESAQQDVANSLKELSVPQPTVVRLEKPSSVKASIIHSTAPSSGTGAMLVAAAGATGQDPASYHAGYFEI